MKRLLFIIFLFPISLIAQSTIKEKIEMELIITILFYSYFGGVLWIIIGVITFKLGFRNKKDNNLFQDTDRISANIKILAGSILAVVGGLLIIVFKFLGKL